MARPAIYDGSSLSMFHQMRSVAQAQAELFAVSYADRSDLTPARLEMEKAYRQFVSGWMFGAFGLKAAAARSPAHRTRR